MCFWYRCRLKGKKLEGARLLPAGSAANGLAPPVRRPTAKHRHEHSTTAASSPAVVAMKRVSDAQPPGLHGIEARLRVRGYGKHGLRVPHPWLAAMSLKICCKLLVVHAMAVRRVEWKTYSVQAQTAVDGEARLGWEEACSFNYHHLWKTEELKCRLAGAL